MWWVRWGEDNHGGLEGEGKSNLEDWTNRKMGK